MKSGLLAISLAFMLLLSFSMIIEANSATTITLFEDDFEDGVADGWTVVSPSWVSYPWTIHTAVEWDYDTYVYSAEGGTSAGGGNSLTYAGDSSWTDYSIQAKVKIVETRNPGSNHAIAGRVQGPDEFYEFGVWGLWGEGAAFLGYGGRTDELLAPPKWPEELNALGIRITWYNWYTFKMAFQGNRIMCYIDDILIFDVTDPTYQNGYIGLYNAGHTHFDDVQVLYYPPVIPATIDIDPDTLNLKSNGQWITAYITLPEGYNVEDIDPATVQIDGISAAWSEIQNGVYMAKFDRATVQSTFTNEPDYDSAPKFYQLTLTVIGEVAGTPFEGSDTITVIKR